MGHRIPLAATLVALLGGPALADLPIEDGQWTPGLFPLDGLDGPVESFATFDDGSGPALYAGGEFTFAGGFAANGIARWDGQQWLPLGAGTNGPVFSLAVFDDGSGPALYAGGAFARAGNATCGNLARWNGQHWSSVGTGTNDVVWSLAVFDDGGGDSLFAAGSFTQADGSPVAHIARWNGSGWQALPDGGTDRDIFNMQTFGGELYASGYFSSAGSVSAAGLARWNGSVWRKVGLDQCPNPINVFSMRSFDDGSGPALFVGGLFQSIVVGGVCTASPSVARFDGHVWTVVGAPAFIVLALEVYAAGNAPAALYATGEFNFGSGYERQIARWNGTSWSPVLGSPYAARNLGIFDDGNGARLVAVGRDAAGSRVLLNGPRTGLSFWDGVSWTARTDGINDEVEALLSVDEPGGPALYAGGWFVHAGGVSAKGVARWNGSTWSALGGGIARTAISAPPESGDVRALAWFDDGSGPALYAGGRFSKADGAPAVNVARWDGAAWHALGNGLGIPDDFTGEGVTTLAVFDDGSGPALYAGGYFFDSHGNPTAPPVDRWNGTSWSAVGNATGSVSALEVYDDGSGPSLYAAGSLTPVGGLSRWNGTTWVSLPAPLDPNSQPSWLTTYDDGTGPTLCVGGFLRRDADGILGIGRWNGSAWSAFPGSPTFVGRIHAFDDGSGMALYGAARQPSTGNDDVVVRWNGSAWSFFGSGIGGSILTLGSFDRGAGPRLLAGGDFLRAGGTASAFLAEWDRSAIRGGNVNGVLGPVTDVLFVNGSAGDATRTVSVPVGASIAIRLDAAPAGPASARYAFWAWHGAPVRTTLLAAHGATIGLTANPTPLSRPTTPQPFYCRTGGLPSPFCGGVAQSATTPPSAPWGLTKANGIAHPTTLSLQAILEDRRSPSALGFSVTNAVVVRIE
ncbi:MAG: hypothetical protein HYR85_27055 [Planctomycetes bacterium]|nr:hypothetical protein [Planctomycetota bacterium]MBI3844776.1 hypothetical protein [Planctomycetota bacterium]